MEATKSSFPPTTTQPLAGQTNGRPVRSILKSSVSEASDDGERSAPEMNSTDTWRVVGSPPRRMSLSMPPSPERGAFTMINNYEHHEELGDSVPDMISQPKRGVRTRAASTPNPFSHEHLDLNANFPGVKSAATPPPQPSTSQALQGMPGFGFGRSIWKDDPNAVAAVASTSGRSMTSGMGYDDERSPNNGGNNNGRPASLNTTGLYVPPKGRTRSKSSSAAFGVPGFDGDENGNEKNGNGPNPYGENIWSSDNAAPHQHRRSITNPSVGVPSWNKEPGTPMTPTPEQIEALYKAQRRFSHAPTLFQDWTQITSATEPNAPYNFPLPRRHSVAGPVLYSPDAMNSPNTYITEALEQLTLQDQAPVKSPFLDKIDDYFENTESRARAFAEAGRNLQMLQQSSHPWPLYVIEFKAGRTDFFFVPPDSGMTVTRGDLVIVEADRGKDLGKVVVDNIANPQMLSMYQSQAVEFFAEQGGNAPRDVVPKKIYRIAQPQEVAMLVQKSRDESDAKEVCQRKIKQKKLPMQIVDAEFQWDRRKLTFYFVSDRRIDFRELVRDLFKIYKTRIWMCQLSPNSTAAARLPPNSMSY